MGDGKTKDKLIGSRNEKSEISLSHHFLVETIQFGLICDVVDVDAAGDSECSV